MAASRPVRVDGWQMLADKYEPIKQQESSSKKTFIALVTS